MLDSKGVQGQGSTEPTSSPSDASLTTAAGSLACTPLIISVTAFVIHQQCIDGSMHLLVACNSLLQAALFATDVLLLRLG